MGKVSSHVKNESHPPFISVFGLHQPLREYSILQLLSDPRCLRQLVTNFVCGLVLGRWCTVGRSQKQHENQSWGNQCSHVWGPRTKTTNLQSVDLTCAEFKLCGSCFRWRSRMLSTLSEQTMGGNAMLIYLRVTWRGSHCHRRAEGSWNTS